jgi:hypothetical protein
MRTMEKAPFAYQVGDVVELIKSVEGIPIGTNGQVVTACNDLYTVEIRTRNLFRPKAALRERIVVNRHKLSFVIRKRI